jgi:predicted O-methyltransferase YrrM
MSNQTPVLPYVPPAWATGHITFSDAAFLSTLVTELAPSAIVEVGVASGCSSAVLLQAQSCIQRAENPSAPWLFSYDVSEYCYFDASRLVGAAVDEMAPDLRPFWCLTIGDALKAREMLSGRELVLGFIDADHRHPWPTLDLLAILPTLRTGAWVALHDIRLPQLGSGPMYDNHGAEYLFDAWPWAKRSEGNIGAVRLDASPDEIRAFCAGLLDVAWEAPIPRETLVALGQQRGAMAVDDERSPADRAILDIKRIASPTRPLVVWGAGQAGREFLARLRAADVRVFAVVDSDANKQGQMVDTFTIGDPHQLRATGDARPFVVVCSQFAGQIADALDAQGFIAGFDYLVV